MKKLSVFYITFFFVGIALLLISVQSCTGSSSSDDETPTKELSMDFVEEPQHTVQSTIIQRSFFGCRLGDEYASVIQTMKNRGMPLTFAHNLDGVKIYNYSNQFMFGDYTWDCVSFFFSGGCLIQITFWKQLKNNPDFDQRVVHDLSLKYKESGAKIKRIFYGFQITDSYTSLAMEKTIDYKDTKGNKLFQLTYTDITNNNEF